jgi:hypothetical protein
VGAGLHAEAREPAGQLRRLGIGLGEAALAIVEAEERAPGVGARALGQARVERRDGQGVPPQASSRSRTAGAA